MPTIRESVGVVVLLSLASKVMLLPVFQGEAFELHRRWIAMTLHRPIAEWFEPAARRALYPLAYPPVFAYGKYLLGKVAWIVDPELIHFHDDFQQPPAGFNISHMSFGVFQRCSVIAFEQILLLGILLFCSTWPSITTTDMAWSRNKVVVVVALILFDPGLIMVDHVFLDYNSFSIGMLVVSVAFLRRGDDMGDLIASWLVMALVLHDQTFAGILPLYLVYLFRHYCCQSSSIKTRRRYTRGTSSSDDYLEEVSSQDGDTQLSLKRESRLLRIRRKRSSSRKGPAGSVRSRVLASVGRLRSLDVPRELSVSVPRDEVQSARVESIEQTERTTSETRGTSKDDAQFPPMLTRPRAISNLEIQVVDRNLSLVRCALLLASLAFSVVMCFVPVVVGSPKSVLATFSDFSWILLPEPSSTLCPRSWPPNAWALYLGVDKMLVFVLQYLWDMDLTESSSVGVLNSGVELHVLPSVSWVTCVALASLAMLPALQTVWEFPHPPIFVPAFLYCMTCTFMLGFHVFERSVLFIVVPLALTACDSTMDARLYLLYSWIGHVSVLPLLDTPGLKAFKPILLSLHCLGSYIALDQYHIMARRARRIRAEPNGGGIALNRLDILYFSGLAAIYLLGEVFNPSLPFLVRYFPVLSPLLAVHNSLTMICMSVYCAAGLIRCWLLTYQQLERKVAVIESYQWSPTSTGFAVDSDRPPDPAFGLFQLD